MPAPAMAGRRLKPEAALPMKQLSTNSGFEALYQ